MESPQQANAGAREKGGAGGKGRSVKRCPYCGAKNKPTFEYCIRCSEPLDESAPEGIVAQDRATLSRLFMGGFAAIVLLAVVALLVRALSGSAPAPTNQTTQAQTPTPAPREAPALPAIDSQSVLDDFNAGLRAYNAQDYDTAIELFQKVVGEIPDNPQAHQYLALAHYHRGEYAEAMTSLATARELRPDSFELLDHYVTAAKKAGDLEAAAGALRDYASRHPDERAPRLELSRIVRELGQSDEALAQTEDLATANATDPEFQYEYGVSLKEAGKLDEAIAALKSSIELDPSSAAAHHALGVTELLSGKAADAIEPLQAAVSRAPDNGDFRFSLAQAYEKLDRIPESLDAYEAYLKHASPDDPRAKVVRERLSVAKRALEERNRSKGGGL